MFEYQKFDIVEVAERCGISLNSRTLDRVEVEAYCPFCPTKSSDYHLYLNRDKERFVCYKCSAGGNSVTLYARVFGVSNKEAYERLSGESGDAALQREAVQERSAAKPLGYEAAPLRRRHDVYYDMLTAMSLTKRHMGDLTERGLSSECVRRNMYRSMPDSLYVRRAVAEHLAKRHDLRGVPGFYYSKYGHWELWGKPGILIPVCDADGYIQGLQIRLDDAKKKKYRWLSSNPDYGFPYGTASNTWIHVAGNRDSGEAYITEGGLKGDTASHLSGGRLFVCTAGASSIGYLADTLRSLRVSRIFGCFDMDKLAELRELERRRRKNPLDFEAAKPCPLERMESVVKAAGLSYERCEWEPELNGIDNYYLDCIDNRQKAG